MSTLLSPIPSSISVCVFKLRNLRGNATARRVLTGRGIVTAFLLFLNHDKGLFGKSLAEIRWFMESIPV